MVRYEEERKMEEQRAQVCRGFLFAVGKSNVGDEMHRRRGAQWMRNNTKLQCIEEWVLRFRPYARFM